MGEDFMKYRRILIGSLVLGSLVVAGCNNKIVEEANDVGETNKKLEKIVGEKQEEKEQKVQDLYKDLEKPIEEVVDAVDKEKMKQVDTNVVEKKSYEDPNEFSKKVAKVLFEFSTGKMSSADYYEFLMNSASKSYIEQYLPEKKEGLLFVENVQSLLIQKTPELEGSYVLTEVSINRTKTEGHFYRELTTKKGEKLYYISTIVKEDGVWKFQDDSPSPPFEEE
jgi:outer membrane murein-binding lipoprotein Lpp